MMSGIKVQASKAMKVMSGFLAAGVLSFAWCTAEAATTVYTTSEAGGGNQVFNPANSIGVADGQLATITGFGWISYQTDALFNVFDITVELSNVTGSTTLAVFAGQSNGAGGFTNLRLVFFEAVNGSNTITSAILSNHCVAIGGCDNFIVFNFEAGRNLFVDSADLTANLVAATPEPETWTLLLLGFAMLGWQLKHLRLQRRRQVARDFSAGVQPAFA